MKILHITYSDNYGGANIAATRIHKALITNNMNSHLLVIDKKKNLKNTIKYKYFINFISSRLRPYIEKLLTLSFGYKEKASINIIKSNIASFANKHNFDVINFHWINNEMISLNELPNFNGKLFWTLHDSWPIDYFYHYPNINFKIQNTSNNLILKYMVNRKKKFLNKKKIGLICPSVWMKNYVIKNKIIKKKVAKVIRNPINTNYWKPTILEKENKKIILFGSVNVSTDKRKGLDEFLLKLNNITQKIPKFKLLIFGGGFVEKNKYNFEISNLGYLEPKRLLYFYNLSSVYIIASKQDNLPNTAIEAMACGTPVITVKNNGLNEIIDHKKNGYILNKFTDVELSNSIKWSFKSKNKNYIHESIKKNFSELEISKQYIKFYKSLK